MGLREELRDSFSRSAAGAAISYLAQDSWREVTYRELESNIMRLSSWLHQEGVQKGERVGIILGSHPQWPCIFFACLFRGAVAVPVSPEATETEIENIVLDCQPKIIFVSTQSDFQDRFNFIRRVVGVGSPLFQEIIETTAGGGEPILPDIQPDDLACLLYTSGTTDTPKGVMLSYQNLFSNYKSLQEFGLVTSKDRLISILPLHHTYPIMVNVILAHGCGATVIYPGSLRGQRLLEAMREMRPTRFVAVPQVLDLFYQRLRQGILQLPFFLGHGVVALTKVFWQVRRCTGWNLAWYLLFPFHRRLGGRLKIMVSGGAKLEEATAEGLFSYGFTVLEGYGLTETSPVLTMNPPHRPKIGSVGRPIAGVGLKISGPDIQGRGEVLARGPNVMRGYYKRADLTGAVIKDGWFSTGDLGYLDSEGYLFLTGRLKDVIVLRSGLKVYPEELERHYAGSCFVKEICIIDIPMHSQGKTQEQLYAVVVPDLEVFRKYGAVNLKQIIHEQFENLSRELPLHKRIMGFFLTLEDLPKTALGKLKRYQIKDRYLPAIITQMSQVSLEVGTPEEVSAAPSGEFAAKIRGFLEGYVKAKRPIRPSHTLELDLGIDSLGRVELVSHLETLLKMRIEDGLLARVFTVGELIQELERVWVKTYQSRDLPRGSEPSSWSEALRQLPREETLAKIQLQPRLKDRMFNLAFYGLCGVFFRVFYRLRVSGKENLVQGANVILYVNHTSYFDGLLVFASLPFSVLLQTFFVGLKAYFDVPIVRSFVRIGRIIPLDFSAYLLEALRSSFYVLHNSENLCLFPEGFRSGDGGLKEFKKGFGILAKEAALKLVPVWIEGAFQAWPRTQSFPGPGKITVHFGTPATVEGLEEEGRALGAKDAYEAICRGARLHLQRFMQGQVS